MIELTLVHGSRSVEREQAIASRLNKSLKNIIIAEGVADGSGTLEYLAEQKIIELVRIAPACPCCTGNLTMRVTLNRILRQSPEAIYLSLSSNAHLSGIRGFLQHPQYVQLLRLTEDINCELRV